MLTNPIPAPAIFTDRRSLLMATPALAALSVAPVFAVSTAPGVAIDPGLRACIARFHEARAASEAWHTSVFEPAHAAYIRACEAVPHHTTKASFQSGDGVRRHMATDCAVSVGVAMSHRKNPFQRDPEYVACCDELLAALDRREAQLEACAVQHSKAVLHRQSDEVVEASSDALEAIENYPVRTLADAILKLETLQELDTGDLSMAAILRDLRRIDGGASA